MQTSHQHAWQMYTHCEKRKFLLAHYASGLNSSSCPNTASQSADHRWKAGAQTGLKPLHHAHMARCNSAKANLQCVHLNHALCTSYMHAEKMRDFVALCAIPIRPCSTGALSRCNRKIERPGGVGSSGQEQQAGQSKERCAKCMASWRLTSFGKGIGRLVADG